MWRLWSALFGWNYAYIERVYGLLGTKHCWVRRVRVTRAGERYVEIHDDFLFLDRPTGNHIITPLTWTEQIRETTKLKVVNK